MSEDIGPRGYRLQRSHLSSIGLNAQHYLWASVCGFNIHPRIQPPAGSQGLKVADIGTGTGIWVIDTKANHQALEIDGLDMELDQCPPAELWPKDCSFRQLNILDDVPEDLKGRYDIIHARLIQGGLDRDHPTPALNNFKAMLKPGGYLQWQEIDIGSLKVTTTRPDLKHVAMDELVKELHNFEFGKWVPRLAEICTQRGFVDSKIDRYQVQPEVLIPFTQTQLGAFEEVSWAAMGNSKPDSKGPMFRKLLEKAYLELDTGVALGHWLDVTVARKPL